VILLCPGCGSKAVPVLCLSPRITHYICISCREIYCGENGILVLCARPAEHVWRAYDAQTLPVPPPGAAAREPMFARMI
jgi:hypothetical protein